MTKLRLTTTLSGLAIAGALTMAPLAKEVRVTDSTGVEVVLPAPAEKVAPLGNATQFFTVVAGGAEHLAGVGGPDAFQHMLGTIFPEGKNLPELGGMSRTPPNVETITAADADVVLMWAGGGAAAHDPEPLIAAGLNVARYNSATEEMMIDAIHMMADLIGQPERGDLIADWRTGMGTRIAELTADIPEEERLRVLGLFPYGGAFMAYGGGADDPYGRYFYDAGAINVAEEGADLMPVTVEEVAAWNPDVIFVWVQPGAAENNDSVLKDPVLSLTDAAKNNRVHVIPTGMGTWGVTGAEDSFYWQWLAELMYPEIVPATLRTDLRDAYKMFFDYDLSDEEIDTILRMDANATSAGYDRFAS